MRQPAKRKVCGYSLGLETLMWLIRKNETETSKFNWMLAYYNLTEDQAWEVYQAWSQSKVHPLALKNNQKVHGTES